MGATQLPGRVRQAAPEVLRLRHRRAPSVRLPEPSPVRGTAAPALGLPVATSVIGQPGRFGTFALIWATLLNFAVQATIWARLMGLT